MEAASGDEPSTLPLTFDEIKYVNNSPVFRNGTLEFQSDLEDQIYEELRIDRNKVLKLKDIREILLNPTKEGLSKILSITSLADFDRVRGQFQKLKYEGYRLTLDVADLIDKRTKELFNGKTKTNFLLENVNIENENQKRVNDLEKELAEMRKLLEQAMNSKNTETRSDNEEEVEKTENTKKSPGRPKKTTS